MKSKRIACVALAAAFLLPSLSLLCACDGGSADVVLRVYNWEEYIDEGGEGAFIYDELHLTDEETGEPVESDLVNDDYKQWYSDTMGVELSEDGPAILDDFCLWYEKTYGETIQVEYSTFGTNEDMYNEIVLGNEYDLLCPSDYMIMKLAAEDRLEKYDESFFDASKEENYYIRYVSPFIRGKFETNAGLETGENTPRWSEYAAGYMWGTTGFVYNPEHVEKEDLEQLGWNVFTNEAYRNRITAKDNVRDTYFAALGVTYQNDLLALDPASENYVETLTRYFNATDEKTVAEVEPTLMKIKKNIYSFETDTGKADMVSGKVWLNYAWSGDAVYALNLAESGEDENGESAASVELDYYVPKAGTNLWFDGWVMPKGANKKAAQAFVNFLSMPRNAVRNSYYIGYTSAIAGEDMLDYAKYLYEDEEAEDGDYYDLSYFFDGTVEGEASVFAGAEQRECRQLFAQYPSSDVISRSAVMDYYGEEANIRINELWSRVKAETLDAWAIIVICVSVLAIVAFAVFLKFGGKIDFFRRKPKKGYEIVKQDPVN